MFPLVFYFGVLLIITITIWLYNWRNPRCNGVLPPGSMGWPLLGETLQFFSPNTSSDIPPFVKDRMKRYGPIFKTSLVGRPIIVSTDADLNYFIFQQEGQSFQSWYPDTFTEIFGRQNVGSLHGFMYKYLKNMVLNLFGPESLKKMLPEVEQASNRNLRRWSTQGIVDVKESTAQGLISFPLDIPGTAYHKCLQGRKKAMKMLKNMLQERREKPRKIQSDFFDYVLEELQREDTVLTEAIALDLMFVINETVRLANIVPGIFRKALREIKFKEYTIPAGWAVMVCPPAVHLNPTRYKDPLDFNPWRWEARIDTNGASRNFMAFGGGMRFCVGTDFTKVQMAVFLHCLVTKYKWKAVKGGDILRTPGLQFPKGFHNVINIVNTILAPLCVSLNSGPERRGRFTVPSELLVICPRTRVFYVRAFPYEHGEDNSIPLLVVVPVFTLSSSHIVFIIPVAVPPHQLHSIFRREFSESSNDQTFSEGTKNAHKENFKESTAFTVLILAKAKSYCSQQKLLCLSDKRKSWRWGRFT
ncbi:hypothetical protein DH2020_005457 [Rehmannia glutinosa]|uniref:Cytochrome P450 n=1 Tax=Rehmannia glutinosa TaxID=99300 RepID=A0ABR0XGK6_REHGL